MRRRSFVRPALGAAALVAFLAAAHAVAPLVAVGIGIKALGAGVGAWLAATELGAALSGPSRDDPPSIDAAAARVRAMRTRTPPASNDDVARYLSGVVDRKLQAENRWLMPGEGGMSLVDKWFTNKDQRLDRWRNLRENKPLDQVLPSDAERIAALAWDTGIGNCNESAALTRAILKRAGEDARIFQSSAGHDFAVIGLAPGADPNDPKTWGPNARVVDGWTGRSYTPEEAAKSSMHNGAGWFGAPPRVSDLTSTYDDPAQQKRFEELKGKANLRVLVYRKRDGSRVAGASIVATGPGGTASGASNASGAGNLGALATGAYTVTVTPPAGAGLRAGGGAIALLERDDARLPVTLDDETDGGGGGGGSGAGAAEARKEALRARFEALRAEHARLHAACTRGNDAACKRRKVVYDEAKRLQQALGR